MHGLPRPIFTCSRMATTWGLLNSPLLVCAAAEHLQLFESGVEQLEVRPTPPALPSAIHVPLWQHTTAKMQVSSVHPLSCRQASAHEAAARRAELLASARRLALESRGLDLLERHVQQIDELVRKLEAAAAEVLARGAAQAAAAAVAPPVS